MPRTPTALLAALLLAAPAAALPRRAVPQIDSPEEQEDPDFHKLPAGQDLRSLVSHVRDTISGPAGTGSGSGSIPSVDLFISNLEGQLRRGNDLPRDKILRNADAGRDSLRAAYNQLTQVEALLPGVRDAFAGANEKLLPALQRNAESLRRLKEVAETARAMVEQIVVERPASPGKPPSTAELNAIASQEAELRALTALLRQAEQDLKKAKGLLAGLKGSSAQIQELADKAAVLDQDALGHVGQRRTRGAAVTYRTDMNSREVLANANRWLQSATNRAEAIVRLMEQDATLKAVERATEADVATMNARDRDISLAERLVFNHDVRLNDLIQYGYDVASDERRQWWVGRAGAAKASCAEDSGKMSTATRDADQRAQKAGAALEASAKNVARMGELLGRPSRSADAIAKRLTDVPTIKTPNSLPGSNGSEVRSRPLKVPHTLDVSDQEVLDAMDGASRNP